AIIRGPGTSAPWYGGVAPLDASAIRSHCQQHEATFSYSGSDGLCGSHDCANPGWRHLLYRSEEHTSELQSRFECVCRLLLEKKKNGAFKQLVETYVTSCILILRQSKCAAFRHKVTKVTRRLSRCRRCYSFSSGRQYYTTNRY